MRKNIIKLRAWDGINKKFTYWTMNDLCTWADKDEKPSALDDWMLSTYELDKNGKEIYEGDVIFDEWMVDPYIVDLDSFYHSVIEHNLKDKDMEVVGNIYENPELIDKFNLYL